MAQPMPQRGRMIKRTTSVAVRFFTMRAAVDFENPEPVVLGSRRVNVNLNPGAGDGVAGADAFRECWFVHAVCRSWP